MENNKNINDGLNEVQFAVVSSIAGLGMVVFAVVYGFAKDNVSRTAFGKAIRASLVVVVATVGLLALFVGVSLLKRVGYQL